MGKTIIRDSNPQPQRLFVLADRCRKVLESDSFKLFRGFIPYWDKPLSSPGIKSPIYGDNALSSLIPPLQLVSLKPRGGHPSAAAIKPIPQNVANLVPTAVS